MTKSLQELRQRRSALAKELNDLMEGPAKNAWLPEHQSKYDSGMAEIESLNASITRTVALHEAMANDNLQSQVTEAAHRIERDNPQSASSKLFAKWLRGGDNAISAEEWANIRATMSTTTGSEGGFTVQTDVAKSIAEALKLYGGIRDVATVITTEAGNPMNWPTSDGTSETGEQVAENTAATSADIVFGSVALNTYKYSSKVVAVPIELLQDSSINIEEFVRNRLVQRIGRITNTKFTLGTGTSEPRGVVTAAGSGKVGSTGQTLTVIFDDIVSLIHSVDPAYRKLGRCEFMMNDSSMKVVRLLKDTTGRPIYLPGYQGLAGDLPDTLMGYKININQDIAVMAANAKSILFGDFSFYVIRDALQNTFLRFTDSAYAKNGQVGFLMFARCGGNYTDVGGGVKYYQNSAT